jgi:NAD(P)-dependent dehydrogenase (short-subunit alcohol dehydrogenase family)
MTNRFENKTVLVTGAGVGIGFAVCRMFAQEGAHVALNDMREDIAREAAQKLNNELGRECVFSYAFDVADVDAVRKAVTDFDARMGRLDVVAANAGITNYGAFLDYTPEAFDRLTSVNLRGTYFTAQAGAHAMIARKTAGRIILTSSVTGVEGFRNLGAYGITKAGILHMTKSLAVELGSYGITVNAIIPGITRTDRTVADDPNLDRNWAGVTPTGKVSEPEDVAAAVLFLASAEARQINGQALAVDGGWTVQNPVPAGQPEKPEFSSRLR